MSDPNYQANLIEKRKLIKSIKMNKLKSRLSMIPEPLDMERKRQFVICKFVKAIEYLKMNEDELATEYISDALYVFSCKGANRFLAHTNTLSPRMYHLVHTKYRELKNAYRELKNNGGDSWALLKTQMHLGGTAWLEKKKKDRR